VIILELRLLADVGLIGFPNAGKSTLLSHLTNAHPKIGNYPFTTLEPQLGVLQVGEREVVVADIPGLIPEAHTGKGLGITFLRHLAHCQMLVFVLALTEEEVYNESPSGEEKAQLLGAQLETLRHELAAFDEELLKKKFLVCVNKVDIYNNVLIDAISNIFMQQNDNLILISGFTGEGLDRLKTALMGTARA